MVVFKDFFNKMTYGFVAFFLLSFAIGAAQEFRIEKEERKFYKVREENTSDEYLSESMTEEKQTHFTVNNTNPDFVPLGILKGYAKNFFEKAKVLKKDHLPLESRSSGDFLAFLNLGTPGSWENFKAYLNGTGSDSRRKGIAAEVATKGLFAKFDYIQLENIKYNEGFVDYCTTKFGPDNGIDGIFIHKDEKNNIFLDKPVSHIIINEAKFSESDQLKFRFYKYNETLVQQSHSIWNLEKYGKATCSNGIDEFRLQDIANYNEQTIIRTATLLNPNGEVKLYQIKDADETSYSNLFLLKENIEKKEYTLQ